MAFGSNALHAFRLEASLVENTTVYLTYSLDLAAGTAIKKTKKTWKRERCLGAGGSGVVWLEREEHGDLQAVKVIPRQSLHPKSARELEVMIILQDRSDLFVKFFGWFEDRHALYLTLEYAPFGDLSQYMRENKEKAKAGAREITGQVLEALEVLHLKEICHRDLKPQNLLLVSISPIWIKVSDFGLSKNTANTELRTSCGTQFYQAPEQLGLLPKRLRRGESYTTAVDMWALGIILYELWTAELPFRQSFSSDLTDTNLGDIEDNKATSQRNVDYELLLRYCCQEQDFPVERLRMANVTEDGIVFVKNFLLADPRARSTATEARKNLSVLKPPRDQAYPLKFNKSSVGSNENQDICRGHADIAGDTLELIPLEVKRISVKCEVMDETSTLELRRKRYDDLGARLGINDVLDLFTEENEPRIEKILLLTPKENIEAMLRRAASAGCLRAVRLLLEALGGAASRLIQSQLLELAASNVHQEILKYLIATGADINFLPSGDGALTPLQAVASVGNLDAMDLLLDNGALVNTSPAESGGKTSLQAASAGGHLDAIGFLLHSGADVNASPAQSGGRTALQAAAEGGHMAAVKLLLAYEADINARAAISWGRTALQATAKDEQIEVMELLLARGADVNAYPAENGGRTALQVAAEGGNLNAVELLLSHGADINARPAQCRGRTALQAAAEGGHLEAIVLLLKNGADVNASPALSFGRRTLEAAAGGGHLEAMKLLLKYQARVNTRPGTALQAAAEGGHSEAIQLLLDHGAKVNDERSGRHALVGAASGGHVGVMELLLDHHADVNALSAGRHALEATTAGGHLDAMKLLLDNGADANTLSCGRYALESAAVAGHLEAMKLLLSYKADINSIPARGRGRTPLQAAAQDGQLEAIAFLLQNGADVNYSPACIAGRTALQAASERGHLEAMKLLLVHGADINASPAQDRGKTALQAAVQGGHLLAIQLLLQNGADINALASGRLKSEPSVHDGHLKMLELLLAHGADIRASESQDCSRSSVQDASTIRHIKAIEPMLNDDTTINTSLSGTQSNAEEVYGHFVEVKGRSTERRIATQTGTEPPEFMLLLQWSQW